LRLAGADGLTEFLQLARWRHAYLRIQLRTDGVVCLDCLRPVSRSGLDTHEAGSGVLIRWRGGDKFVEEKQRTLELVLDDCMIGQCPYERHPQTLAASPHGVCPVGVEVGGEEWACIERERVLTALFTNAVWISILPPKRFHR